VCQALDTWCYVSVLHALATNDVTIANERLSANDVLALALALEVRWRQTSTNFHRTIKSVIAKYCAQRVCVSLCLSLYLSVCLSVLHISKTTCPTFTKFYVQQCNTLCTSGFLDDIMFSHSGANGAESNTTLFRGGGGTGLEVSVHDCVIKDRYLVSYCLASREKN